MKFLNRTPGSCNGFPGSCKGFLKFQFIASLQLISLALKFIRMSRLTRVTLVDGKCTNNSQNHSVLSSLHPQRLCHHASHTWRREHFQVSSLLIQPLAVNKGKFTIIYANTKGYKHLFLKRVPVSRQQRTGQYA